MADLVDGAITRRRRRGLEEVRIDFAGHGVHLTADGEVAVLGHVHAYLARGLTSTGEYHYVPAGLTMPVVAAEAVTVVETIRILLARPNMLERLAEAPGNRP